MKIGWRTTSPLLLALLGVICPQVARGDFNINGAFGTNGDVGFVTSPPSLSITFGADSLSSIYQMDGFVNVPSQNSGTSSDLANGAPSGVGYTFGASQPTANQLLLSYTFVNNSGAALQGFQFLYFLDADVGSNYSQENAAVTGASNLGTGNNPSTFQVGDPSLSTIFTNMLSGMLNNVNGFPPGTPGDVSIALGFNIGTLAVGQSATVDVLLSDNGTSISNFAITQSDAPTNPQYTPDTITVSGQVAVPEPSSLILVAIGTIASLGYAARRRVRCQ